MRMSRFAGLGLLLLIAAAAAGQSNETLVENGSFEAVVPGKPGRDSGQGVWTFGPNQRAPSGWKLNSAYPGKMEVLEATAAEGKRCIRLTARGKRDAQIFRPCPGIRPGRWYRVSLRVRSGTGTILILEYRTDGGVKAHVVARESEPTEAWRRIEGFYCSSAENFESAGIAASVPKSTSAVLDDLRVEEVKGVARGADTRSIRLENKAVKLVISGIGRVKSIVSRKTRKDAVDPSAIMPVLTAVRRGVRYPVVGLAKRGNMLSARFEDPAITARIRVTKRDRYFLFEVVAVAPKKGLETLEFRFPVRQLGVRDAWMPGTYGKEFAVAHMSVTANTQSRLGVYGNSVAPEVRWYRRYGFKGGKSVLLADDADGFLETIRGMELDLGLPSPVLHSADPEETGTADWARRSRATQRSYLFATHLGPGDVDALIRYAKVGGFGLIMLHRKSWRASAGHETIARKTFPNGLPDLVAVCKKIRSAGLGVGLHTFGPFVSLNDAYVTPVPDPRLFVLDVAPLRAGVDTRATELVLRRQPDLPLRSSPGVYPGDLVRIGDEIIRWREMVPGQPCRLVGCERGAAGTRAAAHRAGAKVESFVLSNGRILVDPDSDLPEEMGEHLARVVNAASIDLVYFDAIGTAPEGFQPDRWYYVNRTLLASCAKFDHGVLVQTALGPGRQLAWHLVPRSASADGHGDLKSYLDGRMRGIEQMRRTFTAADIGWYALDVHGRPDELEYVCAKGLAADASISVQAFRGMLDTHPRAREVFEMIARWERRRLAGDVPQALRTRMLAKRREFRLLEEGVKWSLWEARYEAERLVPALDGRRNGWPVTNPRKRPARLALEILREPIATTPARHAAPGAVPVVDLGDLSRFGDLNDARLVKHAQIGERIIRADGLSLRGVTATLTPAKQAPRRAKGASFSADNTTNGAGWCTTGRKLYEVLDLSMAKALGFWVRGDGHGETLSLLLSDTAGKRARFNVALSFKGWRFKSFPRRGSIDWSRIEYVLLELNHIPPHTRVSVGIASIRAVPERHVPGPINGLTLTLNDRTVKLPGPLAPGRVLTIDALGRGTYWPGGMKEGRGFTLPGGALVLAPGANRFAITLDPAAGYPGDIAVRVCRTWPLEE